MKPNPSLSSNHFTVPFAMWETRPHYGIHPELRQDAHEVLEPNSLEPRGERSLEGARHEESFWGGDPGSHRVESDEGGARLPGAGDFEKLRRRSAAPVRSRPARNALRPRGGLPVLSRARSR